MVLVKRTKTWANPESAAAEELHDVPSDDALHVTKDLKDEVHELKTTKKNARPFCVTGRFLFPLGLIFGTILGLAFIEPKDIQGIHAHMSIFMDQYNINIPELPGVDFTRVEAEWSRLRSNIPEIWKFNNDGREFAVGEAMKARGLSAEHPVVLIPGVISTGLESWSTSPDYRAFFREKLWGGFNMISQVTFNKEKWIAAMMLDPVTGLDPPDAKIRAAEGIDAASSFIQGYWIWSKIVENLAVVNYDTNNLYLAPYDWRLSYYNLEERDGYFSKLKTTIEGLKRRQKKKAVIAAHSMGSTAKAMAAFLSGEMKDTVQMNPAGAYVLERFFSRKERQDLFRSWAGSASMWIKGGDAVWGNTTQAPDDEPDAIYTHGQLLAFRDADAVSAASRGDLTPNMSAEQAGQWILQQTPSTFQNMLATNYSFGIERNEASLKKNDFDHTKWTNPLEVRLPKAPSMKIYCVYGHGKETERILFGISLTGVHSLRYARGAHELENSSGDEVNGVCHDPSSTECVDYRETLELPVARQTWIDATFTNDTIKPKVRSNVRYGVKMGEGDGTVSLLSLGAMCAEGWKRPRWNPAGIKVTTIELPHRPVPSIPRGGANTSDHVDILGSTGVNEIILKVATGVGHEITDNYVSNIREYSRRIQWD
ncbi:Lecithin:cholesterol acyltransferase-domain-containing protein [Lyophyllum atratum]|nr:Lecithin:cholesterol acyltransferase-domain-containing protein [Lyophyllum atratum]